MPKKRFAAANLRDIKNRMSAPASGGTGIPSLRSDQALPMRTAKMAVPQCAAGWRRPPHFGVCDVPKGHVLALASTDFNAGGAYVPDGTKYRRGSRLIQEPRRKPNCGYLRATPLCGRPPPTAPRRGQRRQRG